MGAMGMAACRAMGLGPTRQRCSQESEAEAAAIRAAFVQHGEMSAAVELRRLFPGVTDNTQARECARTIGFSYAKVRKATRAGTAAQA
jgi:hypothetical protein